MRTITRQIGLTRPRLEADDEIHAFFSEIAESFVVAAEIPLADLDARITLVYRRGITPADVSPLLFSATVEEVTVQESWLCAWRLSFRLHRVSIQRPKMCSITDGLSATVIQSFINECAQPSPTA